MIEHALMGIPRKEIPAEIEEWSVAFEYLVVPWRCPGCDQAIAETVVQERKPECRTILLHYSPVRDPERDEDGVPAYRPSRRAIGGRQERRKISQLRHESYRREYRGARLRYLADRTAPSAKTGYDHAAIEESDFLAWCDNCPRLLRFALPRD